jgi:hypothetical protein
MESYICVCVRALTDVTVFKNVYATHTEHISRIHVAGSEVLYSVILQDVYPKFLTRMSNLVLVSRYRSEYSLTRYEVKDCI